MLTRLLLLLSFLFLISWQARAGSQIEGHILSTQIGLLDANHRPTLCLTVIETPSREIIGVVEDITDCYYARQVQKLNQELLIFDLSSLRPAANSDMLDHLQSLIGVDKLYISTVE